MDGQSAQHDGSIAFEVVPADAPPYPVLLGSDVPAQVAACAEAHPQLVLLADANTEARYATPIAEALRGAGHQLLSLSMPAGDRHKTREQKARIEDAMLKGGIDRQALLVAVGGGVVCDLGGFVAASYMRGIAHLNVATSLLCQLDAAIGGKTAVNTPDAKNAIGAFHHPRAVILHHAALDTLPAAELCGALAEAIKQAALAETPAHETGLFDLLVRWLAETVQPAVPPAELIVRIAEVKAVVVGQDGRDRGVRQLLNFGHTVAHGLERACDHHISHGEAVAIGMLIEARAANALGAFPGDDVRRLEAALRLAGLPRTAPCELAQAWMYMQRDKKNRDGAVHIAVPPQLGSRRPGPNGFTRAVSHQQLGQAWKQS